MTTTQPTDQPTVRGTPLDQLGPQELWAFAHGALNQQDYETAANILHALVKKEPRNTEALRKLATAMSYLGDLRTPAKLLRRAIGIAPKDATLHRDLALVLGNSADYEGARRSNERATQLDPNDEGTWAALAQIYERLRRWDDVRHACARALELNPRCGQAMNHLARVARMEKNLEEAERWARQSAEQGDEIRPRVDAWHLVGNICERQKRWDEAFEAHTRANKTKLTLDEVKIQLRQPIVDETGRFTVEGAEATYKRWAARELDDGLPTPMFLVGFPRSGTTMTEQILGAADGVVTTDEHAFTHPVHQLLERWFPDEQGQATMDQLDALPDEKITELRRAYWQDVWRICGDSVKGKLVVDKFPFRFQEAPLLNLLFPQSRIVFLVRDPRDCCVSGYFQNFATNRGMVRFLTLEGAGDLYAGTIGYWLEIRERIALPYLEMRYEDLVADPEPNARKLIEFIGKPWTDDILEFHKKAAGRAISTPSAEAVTQKINTRAVGKWANYEGHIGPLLERVRPFLSVWGYEE